jgi:hypothetical protein
MKETNKVEGIYSQQDKKPILRTNQKYYIISTAGNPCFQI